MAKGDEITTKFKVDISDLKKGISEATQQIKLADATFKAATAGMDNWSKSTDGLKAKLSQLDSTLSAQKSKLENYTEQLKRQEDAYDKNGKRIETIKAQLAQLAEQGISKTSSEYKKLENALASCEKEQENNSKSVNKLKLSIIEQQGAINKTEADIGKYGNALTNLEKEQNSAADAATKQKTAYESLKDTISEQQNRLNELKGKYSDVVLEQGKNSDSAKELAGEIDKLSSELNDNKSKLNDADKAADELDKSLDDVGKSAEESSDGFTVMKGALADLVSAGIQKAIEGFKNLVSSAYEAWKSYDEGADSIIAATGATGKAADELIGVYENVAKNVVGDFKDIGAAVGEVNTRFGLTGNELEKTSEKFLKFAELNGTDVKTSIDTVQTAMAAFGLGAKDAGNMLDVLNKAGQDTGVSVDKLAQDLAANAPALKEMGMNASDSAFFLANLSKNGVDASSVMAGMKKALANAAKEGKPMSQAMSEIEKSIKNATTSTEAIRVATELFGAKAGPAIATAVREGKLSFEDFGTSLTDFQGNIETTYDAMLDGPDKVALALQNLKLEAAKTFDEFLQKHGPQLESMIKNFTENILPKISAAFGAVLDSIGWVIDKGNQFISWLNSGSVASEAFKVVVIALTAAFTAFMAVLGAQAAWTALVSLVGKAKAAFLALNTTMAANPIGLVIAAIAALVAAFTYLWNNCEEFREFWINLWEKIKEATSKAWEAITKFFSEAWDKIKEIWNKAGDWFKQIWETIKNAFSDVKEFFTEKFTAAKEGIQNAWNGVKDWFINIWKGIQSAFSDVKEWFAQKFTAAKEAIQNAWNNVKNFFADIWKGIQQAFSNVDKWMSEKFGAAWNAIKLVWDTVVSYFKLIWENIKKIFSVVKDVLTGDFKGAWEGIKQIWQNVSNWFKERWEAIKKVFEPVTNWFKDKFTAAKNAVTNAWQSITNWFSDKWKAIQNVFANVKTWFADKFGSAWNAIKEKFSPITKWFSDVWAGIKKIFEPVGKWFGDIFDKVGKAVKAPLNAVIKAMNAVIRGLNKISIDIPDWVPGVGGKKFGFNIGQIPELAQGGVLKRGQMGLLEGSGAEAVVPLERNKAWISAVTNELMRQLQANGILNGVSSKVSNAKDYNFTQIINAPKQPSRIELYRQTRNLLSYATVTGGD